MNLEGFASSVHRAQLAGPRSISGCPHQSLARAVRHVCIDETRRASRGDDEGDFREVCRRIRRISRAPLAPCESTKPVRVFLVVHSYSCNMPSRRFDATHVTIRDVSELRAAAPEEERPHKEPRRARTWNGGKPLLAQPIEAASPRAASQLNALLEAVSLAQQARDGAAGGTNPRPPEQAEAAATINAGQL